MAATLEKIGRGLSPSIRALGRAVDAWGASLEGTAAYTETLNPSTRFVDAGGHSPKVATPAFVAPNASLVGNVSVGSACTRPTDPSCQHSSGGFRTGSAIVTGDSWRNLTVEAVGGAIYENGLPMKGRYTCANAVANGTW